MQLLCAGPATGSRSVNVLPLPLPALEASTEPPCASAMALTMARPSPVEVSPAVGFADRRWKRWKACADVFLAHAWPAVADAHVGKARIGVAAGLDQDRAARRGIFHRVAQQVVDGLDQPVLVGDNGPGRVPASPMMRSCLASAAAWFRPIGDAHGIGQVDLGAAQR